VFGNPLPRESDLDAFYRPGGEWRAGTVKPPAAANEPRGLSWAKPFDPIRNELRVTRPPKGARVLDFGCGSGKLLDSFQDYGWDTTGIEPSSDEAFNRHRRLVSIPDQATFDLIIANHVLEHVPNPLALLRQFALACKPSGFVFIGTPRLDTLPYHGDYSYIINGRAHIVAFTWSCLRGLLSRAGFEPVGPPPDRVAKGSGKTTTARLRVIARRTQTAAAASRENPAAPARAAVREFQRQQRSQSAAERLRFFRLAARLADRRERDAVRARKSAKIRTIS
jgi:SAM-dependent methyltransferase